jgi:hyperosmotically inducible periplasmic protein
MFNKFSHNLSNRPIRMAASAAMLAAALLISPPAHGQKADKNHRDVFVRGTADENSMVQKVRHELLMLPYYGVFDDIAFKMDGSTVTLLGAVTRPTLKSDAEGVVKRVAGVEQVVNQIEVLPLSSMDDSVRRAEYRAIYGDPVLSTKYGYSALPSIHIIVKNGTVTLHGVVANQADKDLVYLRANAVQNVFAVKNELQVEQGA